MEQAIIRRLKDGTLAPYRELAKRNGRSLEAELRDLIERNKPTIKRSPEELRALSEQLTNGQPTGSDSTAYVRWLRETDGGRNLGRTND
jgi:antitoxin FitA